MVPKVRKGGYIPFFVTERKRSEVALLSSIQEAFINGGIDEEDRAAG